MSRGEPKKIEGGFILTSRKIIESNIFNKPPLYIKVWLYLLSSAQHSNYRGLERGQLITSIKEIQEAMSWKVGYRKETPTTKQIRSILDYLRFPCERDNEQSMIVTTKVTDGMLINIVNYDYFQTIGNYEGNYEKTTKVTRRESKGHNLYNKNVKNDKNDKKDIYGEFENVLLTDDEIKKLKDRIPKYSDYIERLSGYLESSGKKYKSHYATILNWHRKDNKEVGDGKDDPAARFGTDLRNM